MDGPVRRWRRKGPWAQGALIALGILASSWLLAGAVVAVALARYTPWPVPLAALAGVPAGVTAAWLITWKADVKNWADRRHRRGRPVPRLLRDDRFQLLLGGSSVCLLTAAAAILAEVA